MLLDRDGWFSTPRKRYRFHSKLRTKAQTVGKELGSTEKDRDTVKNVKMSLQQLKDSTPTKSRRDDPLETPAPPVPPAPPAPPAPSAHPPTIGLPTIPNVILPPPVARLKRQKLKRWSKI